MAQNDIRYQLLTWWCTKTTKSILKLAYQALPGIITWQLAYLEGQM